MNGQAKMPVDQMLADSLKELALIRPMEKITIKEITDKAGVIRPTFYNHFQDKYELMEWIIQKDLLEPVAPLVRAGMTKEAMILLLTNMEKEKAFYNKAIRMEGVVTFHDVAMKCAQNFLCEIIKERISGKTPRHAWLTPEIISAYYAHAMCFVVEGWITTGMSMSPQEMGEVYNYIITRSMDDVLNEM